MNVDDFFKQWMEDEDNTTMRAGGGRWTDASVKGFAEKFAENIKGEAQTAQAGASRTAEEPISETQQCTVPLAVALDDCPECKHDWSRHIKRWGGHACSARDIDASGNFDGCGCSKVPPAGASRTSENSTGNQERQYDNSDPWTREGGIDQQ